jgi:general secretion pathway protein A
VRRAAGEVYGRRFPAAWAPWALGGGIAAGVALLAIAGWLALAPTLRDDAPAAAATATAATGGDAATPAPAAGAPAGAPSVAGAPGALTVRAADGTTTAPAATLAQFLGANAARTGTDEAFARLFALWRTPLEVARGSARPCEQATVQGLACLAQRGTFAQVRQLDRPAILALVDPAGVEHQVVLTRLDDARARLETGGRTYDADLGELQRYWYGDFLILWRPPAPQARTLAPGMRGTEVRWLRESLHSLRGEPVRGGSDVYDRELARMVEQFQREHRLAVDGIAGVQTQVMLDAQLGGPNVPRLRESEG